MIKVHNEHFGIAELHHTLEILFLLLLMSRNPVPELTQINTQTKKLCGAQGLNYEGEKPLIIITLIICTLGWVT